MRTLFISLVLFFAVAFYTNVYSQAVHHRINVKIDINSRTIDAIDSIGFPESMTANVNDTLKFKLNANLTVRSLNQSVKLTEMKSPASHEPSEVKEKIYMISFSSKKQNAQNLPLQFSGKLEGEIKAAAADYARGFSDTPGLICDKGIYLAGSTLWYPSFEGCMLTFSVTADIDKDWGVISQGKRTINEVVNDRKLVRYESPEPQEQIYLIAGKWTEYNKYDGNILVQAELRTPDSTMAFKYINATIDYLTLYNKLIGPYPYSKFTLVENFWETGFGMPSFTLLGEQVIRFPFILGSSYPHELLHNYWGNSVYVDYDKGNWCEGITVYMADHLLKEQQGQGAEYRRTTLQKFTDFVNAGNDFPVIKFRSRNNSAEEAIGYGKVLMIFEMLRHEYGDELFIKAWTRFYNDNKFRKASYDDIRLAFEAVTGKKLRPFFDQWLLRTGAPAIKLSNVTVKSVDGKFQLVFVLEQTQKEDVFDLKVPVAVYSENDNNVNIQDVTFNKREQTFTLTFDKRPVRLDVDPQFNVFRKLDKGEVPNSLSQIFGDTDAVMILPKNSPYLKEYIDLAEQWKASQNAQGNKLEILYDADLKEVPAKSSWIIGFDNKFAAGQDVFGGYAGFLQDETLAQVETLKQNGALVYVFPNAKDKTHTNAFLGSKNQTMIGALKRKITHYTKYSYLGFANDAGDNVLKGEFPALASPMTFYIKYDGKALQTNAKLVPRKALMY
ncbi:MAG: M1 family aminopeptidase [Bacteroidia bacterium]|nr:M1 family aminopeptidase [Bacteroidia bacterium]